MKLKNYFELMGFRSKSKHYGYRNYDFALKDGQTVHFAQWQHPAVRKTELTNAQVDAYREFLSEGDFCIDIGAHSGDSTLPMAIAAGTTGCALALEPNPYVYHVLEKNSRANRHIANLATIMAAASREECFLKFEYSDPGFCNGGRHENISALKHGHPYNLEVFCIDLATELEESFSDRLPRLKMIKVDTEGFDLYVLRSIEEVIARYKPAVKSEVFKNTDLEYRQSLWKFFKDLGYSVYKIVDEPITPGPELTEENLMEWAHYDLLAVPNAS